MRLDEVQQFASAEEAIAHYGVKGMKWGVRKERAQGLHGLIEGEIVRTTSNGDRFTLSAAPPGKIQKALAAASESYAKNFATQAYMSIKDKDGKKVGEVNFWNDKDDKDTVYMNWITVDESARGRGYASAVMAAAEEHSRVAGKKRMTLEVPSFSPDARHIYEKQGFKVTKEADPREKDPKSKMYDPVWGGLTHMEKKLD